MTSDPITRSPSREQSRLPERAEFNFESSHPSLTHLNADSSWLLSLPYPPHIRPPYGRCRFNIVIDVWLTGPQIDLFSQFSSQEHATASAFQSLKEVNDHLRDAEVRALRGPVSHGPAPFFIDAVYCSHEFTDHCHEASLRELPPGVPVFAPKKAAALVRSWKYFERVIDIPVLEAGFDWRSTVTTMLPPWIGLGRIHSKGGAPIYFHSALAIVFLTGINSEPQAVIYTPHGAAADSMQVMTTACPDIRVLALIHGLHDISLVGAQLNMGMLNAMKAQRFLKAKYWFPTHDEVKIAHGLVAPFLKRVRHTLPLAPGGHAITAKEDKPDVEITDCAFHDLSNGESFVLI